MSTAIVIDRTYFAPNYVWSVSYHYVGENDIPVMLDGFPKDDIHLLMKVKDRLAHAVEFFNVNKNIN